MEIFFTHSHQNIKISLFVDTEIDSLKTHYTYQSTHNFLANQTKLTCYKPMLSLSDITSLKVICRLIYVYEYRPIKRALHL